jgi:hypothetical protein
MEEELEVYTGDFPVSEDTEVIKLIGHPLGFTVVHVKEQTPVVEKPKAKRKTKNEFSVSRFVKSDGLPEE